MGILKLIIKPFDSGWNYIQHVFFKLILFLLIWSWKCNSILKKKITSLQTSVIRISLTTLNIFSHWISKPCIRKYKNHSKASSSAGRFAQNLKACKKSQYNINNCKSERHNQHHTFKCRNSKYESASTTIPSYGLKVKGIKNRKTKPLFPRRQKRMLNAIKHREDISLQNYIRIEPPFLPFNEPNS